MARPQKQYSKTYIARLKRNIANKAFKELLEALIIDGRTGEEISEAAMENGHFVSSITIYNWREGKVKSPRSSTMEIVAEVLGLRMTFIKEAKSKPSLKLVVG